MSQSQAEILARVRRAQRGNCDAADIQLQLAALGAAPPAPLDFADLQQNFLIRLLRNRAEIRVTPDRSGAVRLISEFLYSEHGTRKVVAGHEPRLAAMPWREGGVLVRFDVANADDPVSISYARLAIAESGTLVLFAGRDNPASNNLLVTDHLVVVDSHDLVADYEDAWSRIRDICGDSGLPRGINFISGPSSTADIAMNSVLGVHGPQRLQVIFIGDVSEQQLAAAQTEARALKA